MTAQPASRFSELRAEIDEKQDFLRELHEGYPDALVRSDAGGPLPQVFAILRRELDVM